MSDGRISGPLSAIAVPLADEFAKHHALPPYHKAVARAGYGAFLLGVSCYAGVTVGLYLGIVAVAGFGLLLLVAGLRGAQGPRDAMAAFWCLAFLAGGWWVLAHWFPAVWADFFGRGLCVGVISAVAVRALIALRGQSGGALGLVTENINQQDWKW